MIIIMKQGTTHEHVEELSRHIERWNVKANPIYGEDTIVIGLVGDTGAVDKDALMLDPQVENIIKVQEPFKLANRKFHPDNSVVEIAPGVVVGGKKLVVMAGPCSVESEEQIIDVAKHVQADGATVLRGGAWKPRSSPYSFQGLKAEGLELLHKAHEATGLPVVTEITNPAHIDIFMDKCDCFQVGARNMQNFELLKELGKVNKPILLKRGLANTLQELLIFQSGTCRVVIPYLDYYGETAFSARLRDRGGMGWCPSLEIDIHESGDFSGPLTYYVSGLAEDHFWCNTQGQRFDRL